LVSLDEGRMQNFLFLLETESVIFLKGRLGVGEQD
jgi:hypothetical protein